jgi:hypothetical protein
MLSDNQEGKAGKVNTEQIIAKGDVEKQTWPMLS